MLPSSSHAISFNSSVNLPRGVLFFSCYKWGSWGSDRLNNSTEVMRMLVLNLVVWLQSLCLGIIIFTDLLLIINYITRKWPSLLTTSVEAHHLLLWHHLRPISSPPVCTAIKYSPSLRILNRFLIGRSAYNFFNLQSICPIRCSELGSREVISSTLTPQDDQTTWRPHFVAGYSQTHIAWAPQLAAPTSPIPSLHRPPSPAPPWKQPLATFMLTLCLFSPHSFSALLPFKTALHTILNPTHPPHNPPLMRLTHQASSSRQEPGLSPNPGHLRSIQCTWLFATSCILI